MVHEIIFKKRFRNKLETVFKYIENEFGYVIAKKFAEQLSKKLETISKNPFTGKPSTSIPGIRSFIAGKNRIYYKVKNGNIIVLNMYDMRSNPKKNKLK